jgi:hypothetical protein
MNREEYVNQFAAIIVLRADWDPVDAMKIAETGYETALEMGETDDPEGDAEEELSNWYD